MNQAHLLGPTNFIKAAGPLELESVKVLSIAALKRFGQMQSLGTCYAWAISRGGTGPPTITDCMPSPHLDFLHEVYWADALTPRALLLP